LGGFPLIQTPSQAFFVRLFLPEQFRRNPLIKRIFKQFGYLAPQVFVAVLLEEAFGPFVYQGIDLETAACPEFDVWAVSKRKPMTVNVLVNGKAHQFGEFIRRQVLRHKTGRVHRVYVLNEDFLSGLRKFDYLKQDLGDIVCRYR
jgi:hypothetical protein